MCARLVNFLVESSTLISLIVFRWVSILWNFLALVASAVLKTLIWHVNSDVIPEDSEIVELLKKM